jgi:hypothetical protein
MSAKMSAFKSQNQKRYGSVEKMYVHFYTVVTSANTLDLFWYYNDDENIELFNDFKQYFIMMKFYGYYTTYTGDIFMVKNTQKFSELLILLGIDEYVNFCWGTLQDGNLASGHKATINNSTRFYELFDICFQEYESIDFFSSDQAIIQDTVDTSNPNDGLIIVDFNGKNHIMKFNKFNKLSYTPVKSKVDNITLTNWFDTFIKSGEYELACNKIHALIKFNETERNNIITPNEEEEADNLTIVTEQEPTKISHNEWIGLFSDLYLEEDVKSDILLSDVYQLYLTASGWTQTATVSLAAFSKRLRSLNKFIIKRRSKGMMIVGQSCLVNQQSQIFQKVRNGQDYKRQLLHYKSASEIASILMKHEDTIKEIGHKYAREVVILLHDSSITLDYQTISQFASNPYMSNHLKPYADYIDSILNPSPGCFHKGVESHYALQEFREMAAKSTLYFPFSLALKNNRNKKSGFDMNISGVEPDAFNSHFGMFSTTKEYHQFEPKIGTPQDYDNMIGADINDTSTYSINDYSADIWKKHGWNIPEKAASLKHTTLKVVATNSDSNFMKSENDTGLWEKAIEIVQKKEAAQKNTDTTPTTINADIDSSPLTKTQMNKMIEEFNKESKLSKL